MKDTNVAEEIALAVTHAVLKHNVPLSQLYVQLTTEQYVMLIRQCGAPEQGVRYGLKAPEDAVVVTISTQFNVTGDSVSLTLGNNGCVQPASSPMGRMVRALQDHGRATALVETGDISINDLRASKAASGKAMDEVKDAFHALLADMEAKEKSWSHLHVLQADVVRKTLAEFADRLRAVL